MLDKLRLSAEWKIDADQIAVTYRVANDGPSPVYVIDGSLHNRPQGKMAWVDRLKVDFRPPETAILGSRLTPLNPLTHYAFPPETYAVRVGPGESHKSTLIAPLPLICDGTTTEPIPAPIVIAGKQIPWPLPGEPAAVADRPVLCRAAIFELGVIPHDEVLRPQPIHLADRDWFCLQVAAWSMQQLVTVEKRPIELRMLVPANFLPPAR